MRAAEPWIDTGAEGNQETTSAQQAMRRLRSGNGVAQALGANLGVGQVLLGCLSAPSTLSLATAGRIDPGSIRDRA
jgi:hypothetical protein